MFNILLLKYLVRNGTIRFYTDGGALYCENLKNGETVALGEAHHE